MPAPTTADDFLDLVRKSNLVDPAAARRVPATSSRPTTWRRIDPPRARRPARQGRHPHELPGRADPPRPLPQLHHRRQVQDAGAARRRRHGQGLPVRTPARCAAASPSRCCRIEGPRTTRPLLERFYREARAVAALDHPNIVRAYDIDQRRDELPLPRHGVRRRREPARPRHASAARSTRRAAAHYVAQAADRPAARPRGRAGPPRHQAGQPAARPRRRRQDPRHGPGPLLRRTTQDS